MAATSGADTDDKDGSRGGRDGAFMEGLRASPYGSIHDGRVVGLRTVRKLSAS